MAQVAGIALDQETIGAVVAALGSSRQPVAITRRGSTGSSANSPSRMPAGEWATTPTSPSSRRSASTGTRSRKRTAAGLPAERALEWLRALGESLQLPEKSKEKADVLHATYDRITVAGPKIVGVRLTQAAYAHGLALALP